MLLFGSFSGADLLRKTPPDRYVINLRASYAEETGVMVRGLFKRGIKPQEIAFFTQNDAYGDSGFSGAVQALKEAGFHDAQSLVHGRYDRGTLAVEGGVMALVEARVRPRAVILVGTYGANARFIRLARQVVPSALFLNVSFVGSAALSQALGTDGEGVIITQVVPHYDSEPEQKLMARRVRGDGARARSWRHGGSTTDGLGREAAAQHSPGASRAAA